MSVLDGFAVAVLAYNTLRGLASGLVRTACGLAAVVAASVVAIEHPEWGKPLCDPFLEPGSLISGVMQPAAIWLTTFLTVNGLGILLRMVLQKSFLKHVDQLGGAAFGFVSGSLLFAVPLIVLAQQPLLKDVKPFQAEFEKSIFMIAIRPIADFLQPSEKPEN